jgi:hypothetical protein
MGTRGWGKDILPQGSKSVFGHKKAKKFGQVFEEFFLLNPPGDLTLPMSGEGARQGIHPFKDPSDWSVSYSFITIVEQLTTTKMGAGFG